MRGSRMLATAVIALTGITLVAQPAGAATHTTMNSSTPAGTVVAAKPLKRALWIPHAARAFRLTYVTTNADGERALSSGELFLPRGKAPASGWPVLSWAHGTSGLGDQCAPSVMGPSEPERDFPYLSRWIDQGYAIVATDYTGLGTPGLPAYLDGRSEAHNVVDMVRAGRNYGADHLPPEQRLSRKWATIGQSQGGGAAIYTARYATAFGGRDLHYVGAVGTGVPAYIENYVSLLGPKLPPVALPANVTAYLSYIVESLRTWRPQLGIDGILTSTGRKYLELARTACVSDYGKQLNGVNIGDYFTRPLATLPNWSATVENYMKMPESQFDKPFFMGHGLVDTDVPFPPTGAYVARLKANRQPVTFKPYPADHNGTLVQSQKEAIPFVRDLFAR